MKIACLQFDPTIGKIDRNIQHADGLLKQEFGSGRVEGRVDILVLPELAFTGYNFRSKEAITPYLEETASGVSTKWAQATSRRLSCYTFVGYPELDISDTHAQDVSLTDSTPHAANNDRPATSRLYNSCVVTSPEGEVIMNYRKTFLYETDEKWALEGSGFGTLNIKATTSSSNNNPTSRSIKIAVGICMDLNPYRYQSPFEACEFAQHILDTDAQIVIMPMSWLHTNQSASDEYIQKNLYSKDDRNLIYWNMRLQPLYNKITTLEMASSDREVDATSTLTDDRHGGDQEVSGDEGIHADSESRVITESGKDRVRPGRKVLFVACNRCGRENGVLFAGSSSAFLIERGTRAERGKIRGVQFLGMGEEGILEAEYDIE